MTNKQILKTTTAAVVLSMALCESARAYSNECVNDYYSGTYYVRCYDANGNETSAKQYENDFPENGGTLKSTLLYNYDDQNRMTSFALYNGDPNDGLMPRLAGLMGYKENGSGIPTGYITGLKSYTVDEDGNIASIIDITEEEKREWLLANMPDRVVTDSNGNVIARFDGANKLRYAQGADGSAYTYDKNGNLSKATKRGPFTIPEANALTKDGPVNTVTITW